MLQIKTINLGNDEEINFFIAAHHVIQQGVTVKDDKVVIMFDDSFFEERDRTMLLNMNAGSFRRQIVEKDIECRFFSEAVNAGKGNQIVTIPQGQGMPGRAMSIEEASNNSNKDKESLMAQLYVVEEMLKEKAPKAETPKIFGKKKYANKD